MGRQDAIGAQDFAIGAQKMDNSQDVGFGWTITS
jgi:hypothetical protein